MDKYYLFIKIMDFKSPLAKELCKKYSIKNLHYYESSLAREYVLSYNALFEKDSEYTSCARITADQSRFEFKSDYWNILPNYCYAKNGVLIMSNDSILIAGLVHSQISQDAIYDCLIFGRPYNAGSHFEDVKKLPVCRSGFVNLNNPNDGLSFLEYPYWRDMLSNFQGVDIVAQFLDDFKHASSKLESRKVSLQFSGGSDSVTMFNALKFFKVKFECISFSTTPRINTKISKMCKTFSVPNRIYDVIEDSETLLQSIRLTNGLVPTPRFTSLYKQIAPHTLFDGYAISKGDFSDAYLHPALRSLILSNSLSGLAEVYPDFPNESTAMIYDYWAENYSKSFDNINTDMGLHKFQDYTMRYINQNVNGAVLSSAIQMGNEVQSYFLTIPFILEYFNMGFGFASTLSIRDDYPKYRKGIEILAKINRELDKKVYNYPLDKMLSFEDALNWSYRSKFRYYYRCSLRKLSNKVDTTRTSSLHELHELKNMRFLQVMNTSNPRLIFLDNILTELKPMIA